MRLYHFTCHHGMAAIPKEGITLGLVVRSMPSRYQHKALLVPGYIWLTTERDRRKQSWCAQGAEKTLACNRLEFRFVVDVPSDAEANVLDWPALIREAGIDHNTAQIMEGCEGWAAWRVFRGTIPASWIHLDEVKP